MGREPSLVLETRDVFMMIRRGLSWIYEYWSDTGYNAAFGVQKFFMKTTS